jgi:hypothetical protein
MSTLENKHLDLSVEALVLKPECNELFTDEERETCWNYNYTIKISENKITSLLFYDDIAYAVEKFDKDGYKE